MQDNLTANLSEGWNYLPVLNACDNDADELFSQITGNLQIVKEVAGPQVYWPQFGIGTLENIQPGKAYFVLVDEDVELEYPECILLPSTLTGASTLPGQEDVKTLTESPDLSELNITTTAQTHTIAIPVNAMSGVTEGKIITVHGSNGQCYGALVYQNQNLALTAFGDDPTTAQIDGLAEGETMQFRVYDPETGQEFPLDVEFDAQMPQGEFFVNYGLSAIRSLTLSGVGNSTESGAVVSVYPNPSNGIFLVSTLSGFESLTGFKWSVMNIHGTTIMKGNDQAGEFTIDLSSHPKGIYYLKIISGNLQVVEKLILQ
jgi:hypothetical protein